MAATVGAAGGGIRGGKAVLTLAMPGYEPVMVSLSRWQEYLADLREFWVHYFAPAFYRQLERNFETQGSYVGGWQALSPRYQAWKDRVRPGHGILSFSGALQRSLTWLGSAPGSGGIFVPERQYVVLGTSVPYGQYHQLGGSRLPRRSFLFPGQNAGSTFGRLLHRYAVDMAGEAGLRAASARARNITGGGLL